VSARPHPHRAQQPPHARRACRAARRGARSRSPPAPRGPATRPRAARRRPSTRRGARPAPSGSTSRWCAAPTPRAAPRAVATRAAGRCPQFGSKGVLMFGGDDKKRESGRLELRYHDMRPSYVSEGFLMENTESEAANATRTRPILPTFFSSLRPALPAVCHRRDASSSVAGLRSRVAPPVRRRVPRPAVRERRQPGGAAAAPPPPPPPPGRPPPPPPPPPPPRFCPPM
jgi:hypothetical protein